MEFPERIYLFDCNPSLAIKLDGDTEYIRKDIVDDMLKTAEDHAYFAGSEAMREKLDKIKELADNMYYAAQYLTTDASKLHEAMKQYRYFTIYELKEINYGTENT